jgi:hypothetical protein
MVFRLGILFSAILLGIVMLYLRKRERWEWDKILILFTVTIVSISIFGGIGVFVYIKMSDKPEIQTSLWDTNLSTRKSTIKFIKGPPNKVIDENIWIYISEIHGTPEVYYLRFSEDQLRFVGYLGGDLSGGPSIQGIKKGSSLDDIIKFFGKPSHISESKDDFNKLYSYDNYNVFFIIEDDRVSIYGVFNPKYGPMKIEEMIEKPLSQMEIKF